MEYHGLGQRAFRKPVGRRKLLGNGIGPMLFHHATVQIDQAFVIPRKELPNIITPNRRGE